MKRTMTIISALALLGSTAAFAQEAANGAPQEQGQHGQHHFRHHRRGFFGPRMIEKLGLTTAQQDQLAGLKANLKAQIGPVRQVMKARRGELKALWSAPTQDRNAILAKQAEIDQQRGIIRAAGVDFRIAVSNLLTPQQKAQLAQMRASRRG